MASEAIPQSDRALLEAQAQAGQAGVKAYEAAKKQLDQQQQATLQQAAAAAQARGGPASAMQHALTQAEDVYQTRQDSLTQAAATATRRQADRDRRALAYQAAVQGSRSLIQDQAEAAAQPIRLQSDYEVSRLRQQGQNAVDQIRQQTEADRARFEMEMRAAEEAARREEERFNRQLAAAARGGGGGGGGGASISQSELASLLQQGGVVRLQDVENVLGTGLDAYDPSQVQDAMRALTSGRAATYAAPATVVSELFRDYRDQLGGWEGINEMQRRWQEGGINDDDLARLARIQREQDLAEAERRAGGPGAGYANEWAQGQVDSQEDYVSRLRAEANRMLQQIQAEATGKTWGAIGQLPNVREADLYDTPFQGPVTSQRDIWGQLGTFGDDLGGGNLLPWTSRADVEADPRLGFYVGEVGQIGTPIGMRSQLTSALGMRDPGQYEYDPSLSADQNAAAYLAFNEANPADMNVAANVYQQAMSEQDPAALAGYSITGADVNHAMQAARGMSAYDAMGNDPLGRRLAEIVQGREPAFIQGVEDQDAAIDAANDQAWEDYTRNQRLLSDERAAEERAFEQQTDWMDMAALDDWRSTTGMTEVPSGFGSPSEAQAVLDTQVPETGTTVREELVAAQAYIAQQGWSQDETEKWLVNNGYLGSGAQWPMSAIGEILLARSNPNINRTNMNTGFNTGG